MTINVKSAANIIVARYDAFASGLSDTNTVQANLVNSTPRDSTPRRIENYVKAPDNARTMMATLEATEDNSIRARDVTKQMPRLPETKRRPDTFSPQEIREQTFEPVDDPWKGNFETSRENSNVASMSYPIRNS